MGRYMVYMNTWPITLQGLIYIIALLPQCFIDSMYHLHGFREDGHKHTCRSLEHVLVLGNILQNHQMQCKMLSACYFYPALSCISNAPNLCFKLCITNSCRGTAHTCIHVCSRQHYIRVVKYCRGLPISIVNNSISEKHEKCEFLGN